MKGGLSAVLGQGFSLWFRALKVLRPHRPIHPTGVYLTGSIERFAADAPSGIAWVDKPGTDPVRARMSRAAGLPAAAPDILGLALRLGAEPDAADLLFASTGLGLPGRFLLIPHRHVSSAPLTTVMPYKGRREDGSGVPVLLAARTLAPAERLPAGPESFRRTLAESTWTLGLYHARPRGSWVRFGTLSLRLDAERPDTPIRFDPVLHPPPGAGIYAWTARLRSPAYAAARR